MDPLRAARNQTAGEELANSISHGVGFLAAAAVTPVLLVHAVRDGGAATVVGTSVFAATLLLLYLGSTLYHALPRGTAKRVFQVLERSAIYLLIAGSYTPFSLGVLRGPWGWSLFGTVWGLALLGVVLTALGGTRHRVVSLVLYIGMGWLMVVAVGPLVERMPLEGVLWLVAGGLAYTAGAAFFVADRVRFAHFVWHLFVLAGSACHIVAVRFYAGA